MRKADYSALALIIRAELHLKLDNAKKLNDQASWCAARALENVARQFAACANVKKEEFLKACGIDP